MFSSTCRVGRGVPEPDEVENPEPLLNCALMNCAADVAPATRPMNAECARWIKSVCKYRDITPDEHFNSEAALAFDRHPADEVEIPEESQDLAVEGVAL